jgi:hypothetical protein
MVQNQAVRDRAIQNGIRCGIAIIDPVQKICIVLAHPGDKNNGVARVGHPDSVATHTGRINKTRPLRRQETSLRAHGNG